MNKNIVISALSLVVFIFVCSLAFIYFFKKNEDEPFSVNQTSASYLVKQGKAAIDESVGEEKIFAIKRHEILFDIYIKARSYAILNKLFFWMSVISAMCVLLWPSIVVVFSEKVEKTEKWKWLKSATIQTTITGIAALTFSFYSQYKDKQAYTESLMRYVLYQEGSISELSLNVAVELARIDRGFSFSSVVEDKK